MSDPLRHDALQQKGLKLAHLRLLALLADTGQIGLAAERMGIAQPAASRLLAEVERITGHPVHTRLGRGIELTPVGRALAQRAQRIQAELGAAARDVAEIGGGVAGLVRIGSVTGPAMERVLPALRAARMTLPDVRAEVAVTTSDILCQQLLAGRLDFVIGRLPEGPDARLLTFRSISDEPVALIARRNHPLDRGQPVAPADLLAHDWVMPAADTLLARTVAARLRILGLPDPQHRLSTASFLLTLALLQQSNAIAPLARAVVEAFTRAPDAPYVRLPVDLGITVEPFGLVMRSGVRLPPAARRIADLILSIRPDADAAPLHPV